MSLRLGRRLGTGIGSAKGVGARELSGMALPRNGLQDRSGQMVEPQSKAPRPLVAPRQSRQNRRTVSAAVGLRFSVVSRAMPTGLCLIPSFIISPNGRGAGSKSRRLRITLLLLST